MTDKQIASAVRRKREKKQGVGGKPTNVSTFARDGGEIMKKKYMNKGGEARQCMANGGAVARKPAGMMRAPGRNNCGLFGRK